MVNPALADKSVAEISQMSHLKFIISRIWRGKQVLVPQADTLLRLYDNVLVVTRKDDIGAMEILFGEKTETDWNGERIDWNHIDSKVESRTLVLSRKVLNGRRLGHLQPTCGCSMATGSPSWASRSRSTTWRSSWAMPSRR